MNRKRYTRREFIKGAIFGAGMLAVQPWLKWTQQAAEWPDAERLGRNCTGGWINLRTRPHPEAPIVEKLYEDSVVVWLREVIGEAPGGVFSKRWVETPNGYLYAPSVQPVWNRPNQPVFDLPTSNLGKGMWAEVTIPYVDIYLKSPPNSPWLQSVERPRLYYSQILWIDDVRKNDQGQVLYHVTERYGLDSFWCAAEAFRPLTTEEVEPINPEVENKLVVVDLNHQILSCYEDNREVFFCRISSGGKFNAAGEAVNTWATPLGDHLIWRKAISFHMQGGSTESGWDTLGVPWTTLFVGEGVAVHSTFWHNDFGTPRSHGCVNCLPEDSKWVFRWTAPQVGWDPGDITIQWPQPSTVVRVIEA